MRGLIAVAFAVAHSISVAAQIPSGLDGPLPNDARIHDPQELQPCQVHVPLNEAARSAQVLLGFEATEDCPLGDRWAPLGLGAKLFPRGTTPRQMFDQLLVGLPVYAWQELDGVVVVRPKEPWQDRNDVLHRPVQAFSIAEEPMDAVLHNMLQAATPSLFYEHVDVPRFGPMVNHVRDFSLLGSP